MRVLIDIGHPAHVHYYRNLAKELENKNHTIFWTVKDVPIAIALLKFYGFNYKQLPKKSDGLIGKIWKQILYDIIIYLFCHRNKIDIAIGTSVSIAHVSRISNVKSIVFDDDDDDVQPLVTKYVNPFADMLVSPEALVGKRKRNDVIYYPGYHELAYLHPKRFKPEETVLKEIGLDTDDTFFIMRFNVFKAHHDFGIKGLTLEQKLKLVEILEPYGKVFITTEREIEPELKEFHLNMVPEKMHSLMYYATIFLGDSQTMTSEAGMLGVPSLRCNSFANRIAYLDEQEKKYKLTYAFLPSDFDLLLEKLREILEIPNLKQTWINKRDEMLKDKIDVTSFWIWLIEHYPNLIETNNDEKDFWVKFR